MSGQQQLLLGTGVSAAANYIEDVFSTWLYPGNSSTQTITNGIDLTGKGGMVWIKVRDSNYSHRLTDSSTSFSDFFASNENVAKGAWSGSPPVFQATSSGFNLNGNFNQINVNTVNYASWTFRKQPKFFDVVTYTGTGSATTVSHNLGSSPGCVIIKRTDSTGDWFVWHRLGTQQNSYAAKLNSTDSYADTGTQLWGAPTTGFPSMTSTTFSLGGSNNTNASGGTYVAYLFAHDAGGFGLTGTDNVISCGSYTGNGSTTGPTITLGYEPQWVLIKQTNTTGDWQLMDVMRGMPLSDPGTARLFPNWSGAEEVGGGSNQKYVVPTATGFAINSDSSATNANGGTYIYIAIRRGPMKTPTTGTSVFDDLSRIGTGTVGAETVVGFPADMVLNKRSSDPDRWVQLDRLRGNPRVLIPNASDGEINLTDFSVPGTNGFTGPNQNSYYWPAGGSNYNGSGSPYASYFFRRAPSFFDVVVYTGDGTNNRAVPHNLGVAPEMFFLKSRSTGAWNVYYGQPGGALVLNSDGSAFGGYWNDTAPTATAFTISSSTTVNFSGQSYLTYLFASCPGVSKVGTYTGTGTTQQINCGFTGGARFVLIKRVNGTGDWYVWDSARGIVAGNDPYLLLNSNAVQVTNTDFIDTFSAGFEISSTAPAAINASGGLYIFLAIA